MLGFSLINWRKGRGEWGGHGGHAVVAHGANSGVRSGIRAAGKAPGGMTDRQTHIPVVGRMPKSNRDSI